MLRDAARRSMAPLNQVGRRARALAARARAVQAATASLPAVSSVARLDHQLAVAGTLERLGRVVVELVDFQVADTDLRLCVQAAEAGAALGALSRELFGLRDGRAAGQLGDALVGDVTALLEDARTALVDLGA
jgi:hypothetical protein